MSESTDSVKAEPKIPQMQEIPKNTPKFPSPEDIMREEFGEPMENRFGNEVVSGNNDSDGVRNEPAAEEIRSEMTSEPENFQGNYNSEEFSDLSDPIEPRYSGGEGEMSDASGVGYIKAEVTTGSGAVPIENAVVLITKKENGKCLSRTRAVRPKQLLCLRRTFHSPKRPTRPKSRSPIII